ncbi:hypothetical protein Efla_006188 [Eimeria flavescens]
MLDPEGADTAATHPPAVAAPAAPAAAAPAAAAGRGAGAYTLEESEAAAAGAAALGPRLSLLFEWKETLLSSCLEGLERHLSYAAETWPCLRKVKILIDAVDTGLYFPHLDLLLQQQTPAAAAPLAAAAPVAACPPPGAAAAAAGFATRWQQQEPLLLQLPVGGAPGSLPLLELRRQRPAASGETGEDEGDRLCAAARLGVVCLSLWRDLSALCSIARGEAEFNRENKQHSRDSCSSSSSSSRLGEETLEETTPLAEIEKQLLFLLQRLSPATLSVSSSSGAADSEGDSAEAETADANLDAANEQQGHFAAPPLELQLVAGTLRSTSRPAAAAASAAAAAVGGEQETGRLRITKKSGSFAFGHAGQGALVRGGPPEGPLVLIDCIVRGFRVDVLLLPRQYVLQEAAEETAAELTSSSDREPACAAAPPEFFFRFLLFSLSTAECLCGN